MKRVDIDFPRDWAYRFKRQTGSPHTAPLFKFRMSFIRLRDGVLTVTRDQIQEEIL